MKLYFCESGPLITFADGVLRVEDLNPQVETKWRMTRWEMIKTGMRFLRAGLRSEA
jgi:hypothetical protein